MPTIETPFFVKHPSFDSQSWFQQPPNSLQIANRDKLSELVAERIVNLLREELIKKTYAVLSPSVGRTMRQIFAILGDSHKQSLEWNRVICVQMDEYAGLSSTNPQSFAYELLRDFIVPLGVGRFIKFYDGAGVAHCSLEEYEQKIRDLGGIDCAVHGVGRNGHIAFNEPSIKFNLMTRTVRLAESTRIANNVKFRRGVTLGLGILSEARTSIVVLLGEEKRKAAQAMLYKPLGPRYPATAIRSCERVWVYLDQEATPNQLAHELNLVGI